MDATDFWIVDFEGPSSQPNHLPCITIYHKSYEVPFLVENTELE